MPRTRPVDDLVLLVAGARFVSDAAGSQHRRHRFVDVDHAAPDLGVFQGQGPAQPPQHGLCRVGTVTLGDGLGVAGQEEQPAGNARRQRRQVGDDAAGIVEEGVRRSDIEGRAQCGGCEQDVVGVFDRCAAEFGGKFIVADHRPGPTGVRGVGGCRKGTDRPRRFVEPVRRYTAAVTGQRGTPPATGSVAHGCEIKPVTGVTPWCARQPRMRFRRVRTDRRTRGERRVQRCVEGDGVVGLALQGAQTVVMLVGDVRVVEGVGDGLGEHRVRTDLDEGAVVGAGGCDRIPEPDRIAKVGDPVIGIELRCVAGVLDGGDHRNDREAGNQIPQGFLQPRKDRVHHRVVGGDLHIHSAGEDIALPRGIDDGVHRRGRTGDHRLTRGRVHRHAHRRMVGDQRLGRRGAEFQQCDRALVGQLRHEPRADRDHPQTLRGAQCPGGDGRGHLTHGMSDHRVRLDTVGTPERSQCDLHSVEDRLDPHRSLDRFAVGEHVEK